MKIGKQILFLAIIAISTWITYSNHFQNVFHFDDQHTIVDNEYIRNIKNIPLFFLDGRTTSILPANQAYRPGLTTLNTIDVYLSGKAFPDPFVFHVSIFVSYLILGVLFYFLVLNILSYQRKSSWSHPIALFSTAWFLLHPANAETINYIIARSDSFSTLMVVLAFVLHIYIPASRRAYLYFIPILAGFFVKEQAIMFIPLLFVYKLLFEENISFDKLWKKAGGVFGIFKNLLVPLLACIILFVFSRFMTPDTWTSGEINKWKYFFTQPFVIFHYFYNFIFPVNLVVDTDWKLISSYYDDKVLAGVLFVIALLFAAFKASQIEKYKPIAFGICWFFISLIPTSSIFPFAEVLNDHRTFLPYIGLFIAAATLIQALLTSEAFEKKKYAKLMLLPVAVVFLFFHAYGTYHRNEVWHTEESLWKEATIKAPGNGRAWMNYGISFMVLGNFKDAESCFIKARDLMPYYSYVYINLGIAKSLTGRGFEAEADFKKAIELDPNVPGAYSFYAKYLLSINRLSEAKALTDKGLSVSPEHPLLKELRLQEQDNVQLQTNFNNKIRTAANIVHKYPTAANYLNLSREYYNAGLNDSCIVAAQQAIKLNPVYDLAYNNICASYNRLQNWSNAIEMGEKGLKINPNNELLKANLRESYKGKLQK